MIQVKSRPLKKSNILLIGLGATIAIGTVVYLIRRNKSNQRHARVAEEGYETADDILFPGKRPRSSKLHYGPVFRRF